MSHNDIGPLWMELKIAVSTRLHVHRVPLNPGFSGMPDPGQDPSAYLLSDHNDDPISFETFVGDYIAFLQPEYHTSVSFTIADLWFKETVDSDPVWLTQVEIGENGTSSVAAVTDGQFVMSNRTKSGGKFMLYLMETKNAVNVKDDFPFNVTDWTNLGNYLKSDVCPIVGRDGGFIAANIRVTTKTNDALRKRRLLDA